MATRQHTQLHPVSRQDDVHEWENNIPGDDSDGDQVEVGNQELRGQLQLKLEGKSSGSWKKRELDPGMDCLINAHLRGTIQCQCKVLHVHFNDSLAELMTRRVYGDSMLNDYGPGVTMPDSVLDRIINCAHHHKISTIDDLHKETKWSAADCFGSDVIAIVQCIIPVPVLLPVFTTATHPRQSLPSTS
ncbi:hypothetical protein BD769DRAFT_1350302 [Suillus cothurnatus]|nr:hypothetical protein BD769DRAFT_1350302 [Suillus cothurnatus]